MRKGWDEGEGDDAAEEPQRPLPSPPQALHFLRFVGTERTKKWIGTSCKYGHRRFGLTPERCLSRAECTLGFLCFLIQLNASNMDASGTVQPVLGSDAHGHRQC